MERPIGYEISLLPKAFPSYQNTFHNIQIAPVPENCSLVLKSAIVHNYNDFPNEGLMLSDILTKIKMFLINVKLDTRM